MQIKVDTLSAQPIYEQIVSQIIQGVMEGSLPAGTILPSVRQLAEDLEINPNTVAKAYQILEQRHILTTGGRKGTRVSENAKQTTKDSLHRDAHHQLSLVISELLDAGTTKTEILNLIRKILGSERS